MQVWLGKPGSTAPVFGAKVLVSGPTKVSRSAREPTARMRPPAMAIASAVGWASSRVTIDPVTRSSAVESEPERRQGCAVRSAG